MRDKPPVIFIHGMFVTNACWDNWLPYFGAKGYSCTAPPWPCKDKSPEVLRRAHPDKDGEGKVTLSAIVDAFEKIIRAMDQPPVLIGHSMGGLVVQLLLNRGLGRCGIAIDSAPPKGVFTAKFSFLKSNWAVVNPFTDKHVPAFWTKEQFRYAFAAHLEGAELDRAYAGIVPQSKLVPRESLTTAGKINFSEKKIPLLLIAGEKDNIIPASLNRSNFNKYSKAPSRTDFKLFPGRSHYLICDKGWEELADYSLRWMEEVLAGA